MAGLIIFNYFIIQDSISPLALMVTNLSTLAVAFTSALAVLRHRMLGLNQIYQNIFTFYILSVLFLLFQLSFLRFHTEIESIFAEQSLVPFLALSLVGVALLLLLNKILQSVFSKCFKNFVHPSSMASHVLKTLFESRAGNTTEMLEQELELILGSSASVLYLNDENDLSIQAKQLINHYPHYPVIESSLSNVLPAGIQKTTLDYFKDRHISLIVPVYDASNTLSVAILVKERSDTLKFDAREISFLGMLAPQISEYTTKH